MRQFRIQYLILTSLLVGCGTTYKGLKPAEGDKGCDLFAVTGYPKNWFTASIDVKGHHLSGLLLIKKMPDGSDRIVFTNELGVSFFDFEFSDSGFKVIHIIDKLNIRAVINTLRQDFELMLLSGWENTVPVKYVQADEIYYRFPWDDKFNYIITDTACNLIRLERGSVKKKLVEISFEGDVQNPDKILVQHFNFRMKIVLTKIER